MYLSVVIPCYNESRRIEKNLITKINYLSFQKYTWELILVDDGSLDDTKEKITLFIKHHKKYPIRLISYPANQGKGYAVKTGMLAAKGDFILFSDLDNSTSMIEIQPMLSSSKKADIVIASRYIKGAKITKKQSLSRRFVSRLGNIFIRLIIGLNLKDTQCGFKLFSYHAARKIFHLMKSRRWGFDVEILLLAKKMGYHIAEVPITWTDSGDSKLQPVKASMMVLGEAIKSKYNIITHKYHI